MGAADILNRLRERGVTLIPEPDGNIRVRPRDKITDTDRAEIRTHKTELVELLKRQQPASQPMPEIPPTVRLLCGLDDREIAQMVQRVDVARRAGYSLDDAEVIADRLLMRDRMVLGVTMCIECRRLEGRRCGAARSGQMPSASRQFEPIRHELHRCPNFKPNVTKDQP